MIVAVLAGFVLYSVLLGTLPAWGCLAAALGAAAFWAAAGRHTHGGVLMIDVYARRSRFAGWNADVKVWGSFLLIVLCVASHWALIPLALAGMMAVLTVAGGQRLRDYLTLLGLPLAFLLISGLALLWDVSAADGGIWSIALPGPYWLVLTAAAQRTAQLVMARALGAVSCLYFLSLSTTMPEILSVLRRVRVPAVMIELALLIYRYIFVLLSVWQEMKNAAASRLGYCGLRQSIRTTGAVYGNLLGRSFRRAGTGFDAMESRCYGGQIRFLERGKPVTAAPVLLFSGLCAAIACGGFLL